MENIIILIITPLILLVIFRTHPMKFVLKVIIFMIIVILFTLTVNLQQTPVNQLNLSIMVFPIDLTFICIVILYQTKNKFVLINFNQNQLKHSLNTDLIKIVIKIIFKLELPYLEMTLNYMGIQRQLIMIILLQYVHKIVKIKQYFKILLIIQIFHVKPF